MIGVSAHRLIAGLLIVALAAAFSAAGASAADHTVAVAVFYAPSPLDTYNGLVPEQYAAASLTAMLAAASAGRVTVVPRGQVRAKESELQWNEADALRFARLSELASAAGADRIVVGWIRTLTWTTGGGGGRGDIDTAGGGTGGTLLGLADVVYQVFDATQGRIVYETRTEGNSVGGILYTAAQAVLDDAGRRATAQLLGPLAGAGAP
jgi:hypothetical protein